MKLTPKQTELAVKALECVPWTRYNQCTRENVEALQKALAKFDLAIQPIEKED